jgi:hypothetical protein
MAKPPANLPSIAVLWDDWQFLQTGLDAVYFQTIGAPGNRQFIVQWNNANGYSSSPSAVTFQAALFEGSNDIQFRYLDVDAGNDRSFGGSATVGIANSNSDATGEFLQWSTNSQVVASGEAILIRTVPEPTSIAFVGIGVASVLVASRRRWQQQRVRAPKLLDK